jgi:hypothetical protein
MVFASPYFSHQIEPLPVFINTHGEYSADIDDDDEYMEEFAQEVVGVSLAVLPLYYITDQIANRIFPTMDDKTRTLLAVGFSAGLFHLISEQMGFNEWYVLNGVASKKVKKQKLRISDETYEPVCGIDYITPIQATMYNR